MDIDSGNLFKGGWVPSLSRSEHAARRRFAEVIARDPIDLDVAALLISAEETEADVVAVGLARLDAMADDLRPRILQADSALRRLEVLIEYLFVECRFAGNEEDYYDPRNSYLDEVIERRRGIPISLGVLVKEVGRRVDIPLEGVSFPVHFLLRHGRLPGVYVDPFHGGRLLSVTDCKLLLERATRGRVPFSRDLLQVADYRQILLRMLSNLRVIHAGRDDAVRTLAALDRILLLAPGSVEALQERGTLLVEVGAVRKGIEDLQTCLAHAAHGVEWLDLKRQIEQAERRVRIMN